MRKLEEITDMDREHIAKLIAEGNTSGILDNGEGYRISWSIDMEKFKL